MTDYIDYISSIPMGPLGPLVQGYYVYTPPSAQRSTQRPRTYVDNIKEFRQKLAVHEKPVVCPAPAQTKRPQPPKFCGCGSQIFQHGIGGASGTCTNPECGWSWMRDGLGRYCPVDRFAWPLRRA